MRERINAQTRGFSLIEVVVAMGIVAFAIVSLMALLPTGMGSYQQSRSSSTQIVIVQQVSNVLQNSSFYSIFNSGSNPLTLTTTIQNQLDHQYDSDGLDITALQSTNAPVYTVTLAVSPFSPPGTSGLSSVNSSGTTVPVAGIVQVNLGYHGSTIVNSTLIVNKGY